MFAHTTPADQVPTSDREARMRGAKVAALVTAILDAADAAGVITPDVLVPATDAEWAALADGAGVQPPSPRTQALVAEQIRSHVATTHDDPFAGL